MKEVRTMSGRSGKILHVLKHLFLAFAILILLYSQLGSIVVLNGPSGEYSYDIQESDKSRSYEDSLLFNNILGSNIENLARYAAIRTQLENDGVYDADKTVDVTAYIRRGSMIPGDYITAVYKVSDLIKWAQNGFEYETHEDISASDFLASGTTYTRIIDNSYEGGMNSYLNSMVTDNTRTHVVESTAGDEKGSHNILLCRYQTVDGLNLEQLVSDWEEYDTLCESVFEAANELNMNYQEYQDLTSYYDGNQSNLCYYISCDRGGEKENYTNVAGLEEVPSGEDLSGTFREFGKYIIYSPGELAYETNTLLSENTFRTIFGNYSYAFTDNTRIYIGVDLDGMALVKDDFAQGQTAFGMQMPSNTYLYAAALICLFVFILITLFLCGKEGYIRESRGHLVNDIWLRRSDRMVLELHWILDLVFALAMAGMCVYFFSVYERIGLPLVLTLFLIGVCIYFFDMALGDLLYSGIRLSKAGILWETMFAHRIAEGVGRLRTSPGNKKHTALYTLLPYMLFLLINVLFLLMGMRIHWIFFLVLLLGDVFIAGGILYKQNLDRQEIIHGIHKIRDGDLDHKIDGEAMRGDNAELAEAVNSIGDGLHSAVEKSMKDEKLKADLITNVSHDIKTPLTSIINYVDLLKREDIQDEKVRGYIQVLDEKSQRLKQLTEDLVEASKISSGTLSVELTKINLVEMVQQTIGEFYEKFDAAYLQPVFNPVNEELYVKADAKHLWRVIENLFNNVCKYALENTRIYLDVKEIPVPFETPEGTYADTVVFSVKNISANELNFDAEELTERFIRGDVSRSTEGSGLGLSIAKNLVTAMGGKFEISLDGDLFKVEVSFAKIS